MFHSCLLRFTRPCVARVACGSIVLIFFYKFHIYLFYKFFVFILLQILLTWINLDGQHHVYLSQPYYWEFRVARGDRFLEGPRSALPSLMSRVWRETVYQFISLSTVLRGCNSYLDVNDGGLFAEPPDPSLDSSSSSSFCKSNTRFNFLISLSDLMRISCSTSCCFNSRWQMPRFFHFLPQLPCSMFEYQSGIGTTLGLTNTTSSL